MRAYCLWFRSLSSRLYSWCLLFRSGDNKWYRQLTEWVILVKTRNVCSSRLSWKLGSSIKAQELGLCPCVFLSIGTCNYSQHRRWIDSILSLWTIRVQPYKSHCRLIAYREMGHAYLQTFNVCLSLLSLPPVGEAGIMGALRFRTLCPCVTTL